MALAGLLGQGGTGCKHATHGQVYKLSACMIKNLLMKVLCAPSQLTWEAACLQTQIILMNADMYNEGTVALYDAGHIDTLKSPYAAATALLKVGHPLLSLQTYLELLGCTVSAAADAVPCRQLANSWVLPARAAGVSRSLPSLSDHLTRRQCMAAAAEIGVMVSCLRVCNSPHASPLLAQVMMLSMQCHTTVASDMAACRSGGPRSSPMMKSSRPCC